MYFYIIGNTCPSFGDSEDYLTLKIVLEIIFKALDFRSDDLCTVTDGHKVQRHVGFGTN